MGKLSQQQLPVVQPQRGGDGFGSGIFCCQRCSVGLSRIVREFNFKCFLVLLLSLALSVYALFSVLPLHSKQSGFDAKDSIKISATAQVFFRLQKPALDLIPQIPELEGELFDEIGIPSTKVSILSMHKAETSNLTDVVVGILPNPLNVSIAPALLSLLQSTLVDIFLQEANLTLNNTTFGQPFSFDILKFPRDITLIPQQYPPFGHTPEILFNFTLNNSIHEIRENYGALNRQLRLGLHLMPDENVYIQVTNKNGSTRDPPVTVEASIISDLGILLPQRLKQLAQIIQGSSSKNLGLDNSVFGKVKEVILSSCLNHSIHAWPPSPSPSPSTSPAPSPVLDWDSGPSLSPAPLAQSDPPAPVNFHHLAPCSDCDTSAPSDAAHACAPSPAYYSTHTPSFSNSPAPSVMHRSPNCNSRMSPSSSPKSHTNVPVPNLSPVASSSPPSTVPKSGMPLGPPPLPDVSYGSSHGWNNGNGKTMASPPGVLPSTSASSSSLWQGSLYKIWGTLLLELFLSGLLCSG